MFLLGLCLLVEYHSYRFTHDMQERITLKVDLAPDISEEDAAALNEKIASMPMVKHVDYVSREQAAEIFSEDLNEDFIGFIGFNPLYPSLMVNLHVDYLPDTRKDDIEVFTSQVKSMENVTDVTYQETVVAELNDMFYKISWFLIIFMALLVIICILLIRSTISIALYVQRETIRTMQLVGAKPAFIAHPFLSRSLWYGLLGALMAIVVLVLATGVFNQSLEGLNLIDDTHTIWHAGIAVVLIAVSILISYFSTLFAVNHYLRKNR